MGLIAASPPVFRHSKQEHVSGGLSAAQKGDLPTMYLIYHWAKADSLQVSGAGVGAGWMWVSSGPWFLPPFEMRTDLFFMKIQE